MKNSTTRRLVALGLGAALILSGCSSSDSDESMQSKPSDGPTAEATISAEDLAALKSISMSGELGEAPVLEFEAPFSVTDTAALVVEEGDGDELKAGDTISFHSITYSGESAEAMEEFSSFGKDPESIQLDPSRFLPVLVESLVGQQVGARLVFANPHIEEGNTYVLAIEVTGTKETPKPLERATGETVEPAAGLPTVTLDDSGEPTIDIPADYEAPKDLVVQPLIKGEGEKMTRNQIITAHYTGMKLDGTVFDSSWGSDPLQMPLTNLVQGWGEGLDGQTVGSQVLLIIPPELGYGTSPEKHDLGGETLVFVVDILAAS